jgi:lipoprotein-anchoring transpeptidase ErfK/SrfK
MRLPLPHSRGVLIAVPAVLAVAAVGGVVAAMHGSATKQRLAGGSGSVPAVSFAVSHLHNGKLPFHHRLGFAVKNGALTAVTVTRGDGRSVKGSFNPSHTLWRSAGTFVPLTKLTAKVSYADLEHKVTTRTLDLRTTDATHHFTAILSPGGGDTVGIASPVVVQFDRDIPDSRRASIERHLSVISTPAVIGAWHWMNNREVHWRPPTYWRPGTKVTLRSDLQDVTLGHGVWGAHGVHRTSFKIGPSHISEVDIAAHDMKVYDNGKLIRTLPVSTGRDQYPTMDGIHIALEKSQVVQMNSATVGIPPSSPDYYNETVYWDVRISNSGEFVHAAPWSVADQGNTNVSHGCVNLSTANAEWFYNWSLRGDVIDVFNGVRPPLPYDPGTADWNMSWKQWVKGGAAPSAAAKHLHPGSPRDVEPNFAPVVHHKAASHHTRSSHKRA